MTGRIHTYSQRFLLQSSRLAVAPNGNIELRIHQSSLPDISQDEKDFTDTSFFQSDGGPRPQLPSPASIIQRYGDGGARVVMIHDQNLAVKIDATQHLRLEEAQTMRAMRHLFPHGEVPVPEVFGWRTHGGQNFIYMNIVQGQTLRQAWPSLTEGDKEHIESDLRNIVAALRRITQDVPGTIASINGGHVQDRFFSFGYERGPFPNTKSFNDWVFAAATRQQFPGPEGIQGLDHPDMMRDSLPDDGNVYFTHGDLTLGNIMVARSSSSYRVASILDWEQSGWYPEYWEYCKMLYGVELDHPWREEGEHWPSRIVDTFEDVAEALLEYFHWRGCL